MVLAVRPERLLVGKDRVLLGRAEAREPELLANFLVRNLRGVGTEVQHAVDPRLVATPDQLVHIEDVDKPRLVGYELRRRFLVGKVIGHYHINSKLMCGIDDFPVGVGAGEKQQLLAFQLVGRVGI